PDGRLTRVVAFTQLAALRPPWCHLRVEATVDFKMPGDHNGRAALARADLRRHARWVALLEGAERSDDPEAAVRLDPRDVSACSVTWRRPRWIEADLRRGVLTVTPAGEGCWRIGPSHHDVLWVAANELPLEPELLPFLVARSGRSLVEFAFWAAKVK